MACGMEDHVLRMHMLYSEQHAFVWMQGLLLDAGTLLCHSRPREGLQGQYTEAVQQR